ncbi:MAG: vWA domain-containing protein, partial [Lachnospiraceae bacterium]|nr:vWA domain-containing protein [Lachnospiraceae bacterium]
MAAFLSLAMVISIFPASVLAADGETTVGSSGVVTNKTATLTDDGTYTINLEAYATGATTTTTTTVKSGEPLDIVLVLDQSGSMKESGYVEPLKTAVTNFVSNISKNGKEYSVDHRIALVGYASRYDSNSKWANTGLFINGELYNYQEVGSTTETTRLTSEHYKNALVSVNDNNGGVNSSITTAITKINGNGATYTNYGIEMANGIFKNNSDEYIKPDGTKGTRKRIVVVFTDGQPGRRGYDENIANVALQEAYKSKNTYGATVYTVGLYDNANDNVTNFM